MPKPKKLENEIDREKEAVFVTDTLKRLHQEADAARPQPTPEELEKEKREHSRKMKKVLSWKPEPLKRKREEQEVPTIPRKFWFSDQKTPHTRAGVKTVQIKMAFPPSMAKALGPRASIQVRRAVSAFGDLTPLLMAKINPPWVRHGREGETIRVWLPESTWRLISDIAERQNTDTAAIIGYIVLHGPTGPSKLSTATISAWKDGMPAGFPGKKPKDYAGSQLDWVHESVMKIHRDGFVPPDTWGWFQRDQWTTKVHRAHEHYGIRSPYAYRGDESGACWKRVF